MRNIILGLAVTLDGFIEGPNGEYDWCFTDEDYGLSDFFNQVDSALLGRKSYELTQQLGSLAGEGSPKIKEYIFSTTLTEVKEGATLIKGDIKNQVEKIKAGEGKDIWLYGGASLTTSLMNLGLVDELWLSVHPILLGSGTPLFQDIKKTFNLKLVDTKTYASGLVSLKYLVEHEEAFE
ncbi:MAG: dihydrofolate reductase family protein [Bacteroidota bacterium]|nr:dihydrofolate reductase family protein [Ferruginibacter sp.]